MHRLVLGGSFVDFHAAYWVDSHTQLLGCWIEYDLEVQSQGRSVVRAVREDSRYRVDSQGRSETAAKAQNFRGRKRGKFLLGPFTLQFVFDEFLDFGVRLIT